MKNHDKLRGHKFYQVNYIKQNNCLSKFKYIDTMDFPECAENTVRK